MTNHHPSTDMLLQYSAGTATPSHALCVATHLEFCQGCRTAHRRNNAIGGKLMEDLCSEEDVAVSEDLRGNVMSLLQSRQATARNGSAGRESTADEATAIPRTLRRIVPQGFNGMDWKMVSATARSCQLFKDDSGTTVSLLKLKPGGRIAKHRHMGNEYTVVLTGAFSDEEGVYRAGDFLLREHGHEAHSPVATKDAECVCLTLQEAPLQFTGWLFKLLNPWVRGQFQTH